jgi:hypothetical protein
VESHEFLPTIQRLELIADMIRNTDIEGAAQHLSVAESVAPVFDPVAYREGSERLSAISAFLGDAVNFKRSCVRYSSRLSETAKMAAARRLELQGPKDPPGSSATVVS